MQRCDAKYMKGRIAARNSVTTVIVHEQCVTKVRADTLLTQRSTYHIQTLVLTRQTQVPRQVVRQGSCLCRAGSCSHQTGLTSSALCLSTTRSWRTIRRRHWDPSLPASGCAAAEGAMSYWMVNTRQFHRVQWPCAH
jgi:hypothetical protein